MEQHPASGQGGHGEIQRGQVPQPGGLPLQDVDGVAHRGHQHAPDQGGDPAARPARPAGRAHDHQRRPEREQRVGIGGVDPEQRPVGDAHHGIRTLRMHGGRRPKEAVVGVGERQCQDHNRLDDQERQGPAHPTAVQAGEANGKGQPGRRGGHDEHINHGRDEPPVFMAHQRLFQQTEERPAGDGGQQNREGDGFGDRPTPPGHVGHPGAEQAGQQTRCDERRTLPVGQGHGLALPSLGAVVLHAPGRPATTSARTRSSGRRGVDPGSTAGTDGDFPDRARTRQPLNQGHSIVMAVARAPRDGCRLSARGIGGHEASGHAVDAAWGDERLVSRSTPRQSRDGHTFSARLMRCFPVRPDVKAGVR